MSRYDVEIEAESPEEAVKLVVLRAGEPANAQHVQVFDGLVVSGPAAFRLRPERVDEIRSGTMVASNGSETRDDWAVDGWEVEGFCESCESVLLDERTGWVSDGDVTICSTCAEKYRAPDDPDATQVIEPPGLLLDELDGTGPEATAGEAFGEGD